MGGLTDFNPGCALFFQGLLQSFECYIQPNLVAVFETIGDGLGD